MYEMDYTSRPKFPGAPENTTESSSKNYNFTGGYVKPEDTTVKDEVPDFYNNKSTGCDPDPKFKQQINNAYSNMYGMSTVSPYMYALYNMAMSTMVKNMHHISSNAYAHGNVDEIIDVLIYGSIDDILKFTMKNEVRNDITSINIGKMCAFMIDVIQSQTLLIRMHEHNTNDEDKITQLEYHLRDLHIHYIEACRNVAIYMMDHFSPHQIGWDLELPNKICNDIIYILKIDLGDIAIEDAPKLELYKNIEILCCNNITFQKTVINEINRYYTDET